MSFSPTTSWAAGTFSSVENKTFAPSANVLARKTVIIGTYDPLKTGVVAETMYQIFSPEQAGSVFGFGSMIHRLALWNMKGSGGLETWVIPQEEVSGTQATGTITFTGATWTKPGTYHLYIHGDYVPFTVTADDTPTTAGDACVAAINANTSLNVTAANLTGVVTLTSKTTGYWGNYVTMAFDLAKGQESHDEFTPTLSGATLTSGTGLPDIQTALDVLGTGDDQNEDYFTELVHGYGWDDDSGATLQTISVYNGLGDPNDPYVGNYAKEVGRPFRTRVGDTAAGSAGLAALIAFGDTAINTLDRTNGITAVPGSQTHPQEIAALHLGIMSATNHVRAQEGYIKKTLPGVWPGPRGDDRWTKDYDSIDLAEKAGISATKVKNGVVTLKDTITMYHPESVSLENNGYKSDRHNSITQNILANNLAEFDSPRWDGITIVADSSKVDNSVDREKVVDRDTVVDVLGTLATLYEGKSWLFTAGYTIDRLNADPSLVEVRPDARGFLITFPVIYSGENAIMDVKTYFDVSIRVLG